MHILGSRMGVEVSGVQITLDAITITVRNEEGSLTRVREVGPPGVNSQRIADLEQIVRNSTGAETLEGLRHQIETATSAFPHYAPIQICLGIGAASGAFAFLNGGTIVDILSAGICGGIGQSVRSALHRRQFNHFATALVSAVIAAGINFPFVSLLLFVGAGLRANHSAGLISTVLFLVPGFPLVAALLDLLSYQMSAALARFAYGFTLLASAAIGLAIVVALSGISIAIPPAPYYLPPIAEWGLRLTASFCAAAGFAMVFNSSIRGTLLVGLLAMTGNGLRLLLRDIGVALPPAAFLGAFAVGVCASLAAKQFREPRVALTVPGIIIMWPGVYAFQAVVFSNQGEILAALQAAVLVIFVLAALATGLAAARFVTSVVPGNTLRDPFE